MKNLLFVIAFLIATANSFSQVYVQGYTRSNGTYVQGHYRTAPNATRNDNYSTVGNTNPYTGKAGTVSRDSYRTSTYSTPTYTNTYSTPTYSTPTPTYTNTYSTPTYSTPTPTYTNTYSTPTYSTPSYSTPSYSSQTIYTGPRGGTYYINSNGNKTYVR